MNSFLKDLQIQIEDSITKINEERNDIKNRDKKDFVVKECQRFYDSFIDKNLNIPFFIDWGIKSIAIPLLIDLFVIILKDKGVIK